MLEVQDLVKDYAPPSPGMRLMSRTASTDEVVHALCGVSLSVSSGEVVGLVGPNGAGKTTLIKIIAQLLDASSGRVWVDGLELGPATRAKLGLLLTDDRGLYWRLTGTQNLRLFAAMAGLDRARTQERVAEVLDMVGLTQDRRLVFGYSSGMRARLGLARALLADPRLLILDEPTRSLDPVMSAELGRLLRMLAERGTAVLLASHRLDEVVSVCNRVEVLVAGRVRRSASTDDLRASPDASNELLEAMRPAELPR